MTLAQIYNHLSTATDYFSRSPLTSLDLIILNPISPIRCKAEAQRYARCMNFGADILQAANHTFAHELWVAFHVSSQCARENQEDPDVLLEWVAGKLHQYARVTRMFEVEIAFRLILPNRVAFEDVALDVAMLEVLQSGITPQRQEIVERHRQQLAEEQARVDEQRRQERLVRMRLAAVESVRDAEQRLGDAQRYLARMQDGAAAPAQGEAAGAEPAEDPSIDVPRYRLDRHCRQNNVVRMTIVRLGLPKYRLYLTEDKLKLFESQLVTKVADDDETTPVCGVCMENAGVLGCGNSHGNTKCTGLMCWNCWHTWHAKTDRCPMCRGEYIPLGARESAAESAGTK